MSVIYQSYRYPQIVSPDMEVYQNEVDYRPMRRVAGDPRSGPSLREEIVVKYDWRADKIVATSRLECMDGTISSIGGPPLDMMDRPVQGEATSTFVLSCPGAGTSVEYGVAASTAIQGSTGQLKVGDHASVLAHRLSAKEELIADTVAVAP